LYPDANLGFPGPSLTQIRNSNYTQDTRGLISESLVEMKKYWTIVRFGIGTDGGKGLAGMKNIVN
jgi:hypothetical protein